MIKTGGKRREEEEEEERKWDRKWMKRNGMGKKEERRKNRWRTGRMKR